MKKNITIKSNINKTVKIQYLHQNPNLLKIYFKQFLTLVSKKTHSKKEWENCYEKEKVTEFKNPAKQIY
ncbi:hypothetical protein LCM02_06790 [Lutimonas saemankumensis]|uniref:hypothetical protein n=1 Tax=Lutimonas saemankumensis TaxID=483016 RepID=UPI001CD3306E|nr:hypothetical protein [Lutimonas saemankumensis]MCA0932151.1 hypothetical protein [Lutimonas saemankumensis]